MSKRLDMKGEGAVTFKLVIDGKVAQKGVAIGYITDGVETNTVLNIDKQCKVSAKSKVR